MTGLQITEGVVVVRPWGRRPRTFPPGTLTRAVSVERYDLVTTAPSELVLFGPMANGLVREGVL